jgi:CheY-like chemotaxis protein
LDEGKAPTPRPVVLIVDDDRDTCDLIEEVLQDDGFDTVSMPDGDAALQHLQEHGRAAVVLLDLMMPQMNGWTFVSRVRSIPGLADLQIIAVTATGPHWGYPVTQVLHKPIGKHQVLEAVRAAVRRDRPDQSSG